MCLREKEKEKGREKGRTHKRVNDDDDDNNNDKKKKQHRAAPTTVKAKPQRMARKSKERERVTERERRRRREKGEGRRGYREREREKSGSLSLRLCSPPFLFCFRGGCTQRRGERLRWRKTKSNRSFSFLGPASLSPCSNTPLRTVFPFSVPPLMGRVVCALSLSRSLTLTLTLSRFLSGLSPPSHFTTHTRTRRKEGRGKGEAVCARVRTHVFHGGKHLVHAASHSSSL